MLVNYIMMIIFVFLHFDIGWAFVAFILTPAVTSIIGTPVMLIIYDAPYLPSSRGRPCSSLSLWGESSSPTATGDSRPTPSRKRFT